MTNSNKAITKLDQKLAEFQFENDTNIYIICSMPLSDMGKGTTVAHMLSFLEDSNAIKFDGLFNTNATGRHTATGHDDFGTYEKYNSNKKFTEEHYILGGDLFREFIDKYGEYENLCFRPHIAKHFIAKIGQMWQNIGKPKNLILEIGGTIIDYEVDPYVPFAISYYKQKYGERCKIILLTEMSYNNQYVKTRSIQRAIEEFAKRLIIPDILLVREPANFGKCGILEKVENEKTISEKIEERLGFEFNPKKIIAVPFFEQNEIDYLGTYLRERLKPLLQKPKKQIFIGSNNQSKIADWTSYLTDFEVFWPNKLNLKVEIEENMTSLVENSQKKAKTWAKISQMLTLSEDTGFFIPELGGLPGICVKKWGGELAKELTDTEFLTFFYNKVKGLQDLSCYFETVFSVADAKGLVQNITFQNHGRIDLSKFGNLQNPNYPLSAVFVAGGRNTAWSEMTTREKIEFDKPMIDKVKTILENFGV